MSYMDDKNILSEGFFSDLKKYLQGKKNLSGTEKKALKDPTVKKAYMDFLKAGDEFDAEIEKLNKKYGWDIKR